MALEKEKGKEYSLQMVFLIFSSSFWSSYIKNKQMNQK